jgi:hypothetical protein
LYISSRLQNHGNSRSPPPCGRIAIGGTSAGQFHTVSVAIEPSFGSSNTRLKCPLFRPRTMSQTHPNASSSSSSNFQSVLNAAIDAYEKKTKSKLLTHPLAAQLQSCNSPTAILSVLQDLIQQFDRRRSSDERLTNWLKPTVNVLYALSSTLGQGVGLVSLNSLVSWNLCPDCHSSGILTRQRGILRHRRPSFSEYHPRSLSASCNDTGTLLGG